MHAICRREVQQNIYHYYVSIVDFLQISQYVHHPQKFPHTEQPFSDFCCYHKFILCSAQFQRSIKSQTPTTNWVFCLFGLFENIHVHVITTNICINRYNDLYYVYNVYVQEVYIIMKPTNGINL